MKIYNKTLNKKYHFNLQDKNLFLVNNLDGIVDIKQAIENIVAGKLETTNLRVDFEPNDISLNKSEFKIINVPTYMEFSKDINGGNKSIFKDLLSIVLKQELFSSETLSTLFSLIESVDLTELKPLETLQKNFSNSMYLNLEFQIQDQFINYLVEQTLIKLSDFENNEVILDHYLTKQIYFEIINLLWRMDDKNIFFIFNSPFQGMCREQATNYLQKILNLKYFVIFNDKGIDIDDNFCRFTKIMHSSKLVDFSKIYDEIEFYLNFSSVQNEEELIEEVNCNIRTQALMYNVYTENEFIKYAPFEYIFNI